MAKKVFAMYLAKEGNPNSDAYAKLDLPASPWELWDALDKVRLQKEDSYATGICQAIIIRVLPFFLALSAICPRQAVLGSGEIMHIRSRECLTSLHIIRNGSELRYEEQP